MNIFVLDNDPKLAAREACDKHVVKMIVETAQMLSTAHRYLDGSEYIDKTATGRKIKRYRHPDSFQEAKLCKAVMINHPCTKWTMETDSNYYWLHEHGVELLHEYKWRYLKTHAMNDLFNVCLYKAPSNIKSGKLTQFAQAMPDKYKASDAVDAYRNYYIGEKAKFARWTSRNIPTWFVEGLTRKASLV